ncbi:MAG: hypothetical protein ACOCYF_01025 [Bacteroidota bacterium]
MVEEENIYDKIQEIFGTMPANLNVLEEEIDVDLQMEYFEHSKNHKTSLSMEEIIQKKDDIFLEGISVPEKKDRLVELASIENIEAYRTIQRYLQEPEDDLRDWAMLALQESRMLIESKLLDENQIFISTGLGGKGFKLRYFVVILSRNFSDFTRMQRKIIRNEFEYILKKVDAEIEEIRFRKNMSSILAIIPLNISIKDIFRRAIEESNQYGDFIKTNFLVTNVKKLSFREIKDFVEKQRLQEKI